MHASILLAILPLALATLNNPLLTARDDDCLATNKRCGAHCIPDIFTCCEDSSVGCATSTTSCQKNSKGVQMCCIMPDGKCTDDSEFIDAYSFDPKSGEIYDGGNSGASGDGPAASPSPSSGSSSDSSSDDPSGSATSTGGAPAMTNAAGLAMAVGAGFAVFL